MRQSSEAFANAMLENESTGNGQNFVEKMAELEKNMTEKIDAMQTNLMEKFAEVQNVSRETLTKEETEVSEVTENEENEDEENEGE